MKTIFKTKTERNNQETISKSLAVIIIIALVSVSLNAQDLDYLIPEKSRIHETTLALVNNTSGINRVAHDAKSFSTYIETATEEALDPESWMMNESTFSAIPFNELEHESEMEIESWMTNEFVFNADAANLEIEREKALDLESWMKDENTFHSSTPLLTVETESALVIEKWMLNENEFLTSKSVEQPLQLEYWMISELTWK